jgi:C_GCAxxG_C_C family probable redox protein
MKKEIKLSSNGSVRGCLSGSSRVAISRRSFFTRTVGGAAGLSLIACPGIVARLWAAPDGQSREDIRKELEAKADKFMMLYRTCSQTSFAALNEQFGLQADQAIPGLMPFAGGIAGKGETCGAVSGSLLALGTFFEAKKQTGMKQGVPPFRYALLFFDGFEKAFGSTRCRDVVKFQYGRYYDFLNPDDQKSFMAESQKSQKCLEVVKKAVLLAGDIIIDNS